MNEIEKRILNLLRDLILIPSTSDNPDGLVQAVNLIRNHVDENGAVRVETHCSHGWPSLVARPADTEAVEIFLVGHVDVVASDPEGFIPAIEGNRLYGRGAGDMKGQVAILTEVFRNLVSKRPDLPLGLMITADEESGGHHGVGYLLNEQDYRCQTAILPDSGSLNEIVVREKGILRGRIVCRGASGHSARPWLSDNAAHRLVRTLAVLTEHFGVLATSEQPWHSTLSATVLETRNQTHNCIPNSASAVVDIRFTERETADGLIADIREMMDDLTEFQPDVIAEPLVTEPDPLFVAVTEEVTGRDASLVGEHGGSDGRYFTRKGIPVIMSRPNVGGLHSDREWIEIDSMLAYYHILDRYLRKKLGAEREPLSYVSEEGWGD